ncbi:MAG: ribosome maturation factor RimP [Marinoscillum sp.]
MRVGKQIEEEVTGIVEEIISEDSTLFVVKVILKGNSGSQRLIVLLDGDQGINIDRCSKVSRALSAILEEQDLIDDKYHLEVSSAGLDFPLQSVRQYKKNVGRSLKVDLLDGSNVSGELKDVNDDLIVLEEKQKKETKSHEINFSEIEKSMVLVSFK